MNRYFYPDESATSQILTELATALVQDFPVSVITSRQSASDVSARFEPGDVVDGVNVVRLRTTRLGRSALWRRAVDYVSFHMAVMFFLLRHVARDDIVVLKTDPPLLQLFNTSLIRLKRGRVINWLQDIYPEIAVRLARFPGPQWLSNGIAAWRDRALRAARVNVVVSAAMATYLQGRGLTNTRVITNWADELAIAPLEPTRNPLRVEWGLQGKFTVMYSGNFGRAHSFSEIAGAVRQLASRADICFVFVGEGAGLNGLRSDLARGPVGNFLFKPFQSKVELSCSLGVADLHLVTLKPGMEDLLMPSKIYGILAAGRGVAFVGEENGRIATWIRKENLGVAVASGDIGALVEAILQLKDDRDLLAKQQANARHVFEANHTRALAVESWKCMMKGEICGKANRSTSELR